MSDYILHSSGQVTSSKTPVRRVGIFSICLIVFGLAVLLHSITVLISQEGFFRLQVSKAYFALPASVIVICSGLLVIISEIRYSTQVFVSQEGIKVLKGHSIHEICWHDIGCFECDKFGITVSAEIIGSEIKDGSNKSFRVPLLGNNASNFADFLNEIRVRKSGASV